MWDERYSGTEFAFGTEPNDFLRETFEQIPVGGHVLCLAEGEGRNAVFLAEQGFKVTAMDMSEVGLNKANKLALLSSQREYLSSKLIQNGSLKQRQSVDHLPVKGSVLALYRTFNMSL